MNTPPRRRDTILTRQPGAAALTLATALWSAGACTATVRPAAVPPAEPMQVILVREALHSGVAFPRPEGGFVEHGFGEWAWYAEGRDAWYRVFPTVLWPTAGAWSRRTSTAASLDALRQRWPGARLAPLTVERRAAERLRDRLESRWFDAPGPVLEHGPDRPAFARAGADYWFGYNCHDATAHWLEELGCEVTWVPIRGSLEVADPLIR